VALREAVGAEALRRVHAWSVHCGESQGETLPVQPRNSSAEFSSHFIRAFHAGTWLPVGKGLKR